MSLLSKCQVTMNGILCCWASAFLCKFLHLFFRGSSHRSAYVSSIGFPLGSNGSCQSLSLTVQSRLRNTIFVLYFWIFWRKSGRTPVFVGIACVDRRWETSTCNLWPVTCHHLSLMDRRLHLVNGKGNCIDNEGLVHSSEHSPVV